MVEQFAMPPPHLGLEGGEARGGWGDSPVPGPQSMGRSSSHGSRCDLAMAPPQPGHPAWGGGPYSWGLGLWGQDSVGAAMTSVFVFALESPPDALIPTSSQQ